MKLTLKPAGSNTSLQINQNGQLGSVSGSSYDGTTLTVSSLSVSSLSLPVPGSGTELQYRSSSTSFGAVTGSSFSGGVVTLPTLAVTDLTSGRIPFAGSSGRLQDSTNLTWSSPWVLLGNSGTYLLAGVRNENLLPTLQHGSSKSVRIEEQGGYSGNLEAKTLALRYVYQNTGYTAANATLEVSPATAGTIGQTINLASGQTADAVQIKHYNTTVLSRFLSDGQLYLDNGTGGGSTAGTGLRISNQGSTTLTLSPNSLHNNGTLIVGARDSQMLFCSGGGATIQLCPGGYGVVGFQATNTQVDAYRPTVITNNTVGSPVLTLTGASGQTADLFQANPYGVTAGTRARVTSAGRFSCNDGFTGSEAFGDGAYTTGTSSVAVGYGAYTGVSGGQGVAVAVGRAAYAGFLSNAIGCQASASADNSIAIGHVATSNYATSIAVGYYAATTAANQVVFGSSDGPYNDVYFGKGVTHATPTAWTLHGTGGSGTNIVGGTLYLAPGQSTGLATPSAVIIQGTTAGVSGSTAQTLSDLATFGNGKVTIANPSISTTTSGTSVASGFHISPSGGDGTLAGITFGGSTGYASTTEAGILSQCNSGTGSSLLFATANSYVSGMTVKMSIAADGTVGVGSGSAAGLLGVGGMVMSGYTGSDTIGFGGAGFSMGDSNGGVALRLASSRSALCFDVFNGSWIEAGRFTTAGKFGVGTAAPDKQVEINSATGDCLRLTYNDSNGSATNYGDLAISSGGNLTITPSGGTITLESGVIINESGADRDTRIEGVGDANLFFVDAGNARVAIGTNAPDYKFDISSGSQNGLRVTTASSSPWPLMINNATYGTTASHGLALWQDNSGNAYLTNTNVSSLKILATSGNWIINPLGNNQDTTIQGDTKTHLFFLDASVDSIGIDQSTPTAKLHIGPGTTAAGTAPFKLTTQASGLTTVEQGAMELVGNSLQFTQLAKRRGVAMSQSTRTSDTTVGNTATESAALITAEHSANYLEVGKCEEIVLRGTIRQTNVGGGQLQVRIKYAGSTIQTITTNTGNIAAGTPFELRVSCTCRSTGATGTMQFNSVLWIDGITNIPDSVALPTIDTTTAQDTTVTFQWTVANASNTTTVNQGRVLCIEPNR